MNDEDERLLSFLNTRCSECSQTFTASSALLRKQKNEHLTQTKASGQLLLSEIENLKAKKASKEQETVAGEKQLREMTEAIDLKLRVRERLDAEVSALKTNNVSLKQDIDIRKKDCDEIQQSIQFAQQVYRERLGLKIDLVHSSDKAVHFEFKFTNIDSKDPQRIFAVALKVSADKKVSVTDCQPIVKDLDVLLGKLRETNDWHQFVVELRRQFTRLI